MDKVRIQPAGIKDPERYSLGWKLGNTVYLAGAIGYNEDGSLSPDIRVQTQRAWDRLAAVLREAGGSLRDIVKVTVYLTDMRYQQAQGEVRAALFPPGTPPASTLVQCVALAEPAALIEIEGIAVLDR
ncbi:MAG TPA: RidA family protein [Chloroflexota bacterium]|nr:RidA family protein [Chloroflexota bacterium]